MSVPDFQSLMLPAVKLLKDGKEYNKTEITNSLAKEFNLSEEDLHLLLPSGKQTVLSNRVGWALTYLKKAKVLEAVKRAVVRITPRGQDLLKSKPDQVNMKTLERYPEFLEFKSVNANHQNKGEEKPDQGSETPEETLEKIYEELKNTLAQELLECIMKCSPQFFENLVIDLLLAMGYGGSRKDAGQAVGKSGDGGIDGIIKEDRLGLDNVYIQAKRWDSTVGRPVLQAFAGALIGKKANKGVFITTSSFSKDARDYVNTISPNLVLIDGKELANLMIDYNVGVTDVAKYVLKKIDLDYFDLQ
ncbi:MAG: restriction endonuclease [Candidatus Eremiobacterota bacterium]